MSGRNRSPFRVLIINFYERTLKYLHFPEYDCKLYMVETLQSCGVAVLCMEF